MNQPGKTARVLLHIYSITFMDSGSKWQKADIQTNSSKLKPSCLYVHVHFLPLSPQHSSAESAARALGSVMSRLVRCSDGGGGGARRRRNANMFTALLCSAITQNSQTM